MAANIEQFITETLAPGTTTWLLTYLVHSTLLMGIVWVLTRTRFVKTYLVKDLLWKTAFVGGVLTATLSLATGGTSLTGRLELPALAVSATSAALAGEALPVITGSAGDGQNAGIPGSALQGTSPEAKQGQEPRREPSRATQVSTPWTMTIMGLWLLGMALAGARYASRKRRLARHIGDRHPVSDGPLTGMLRELCIEAGVRQEVRLTVSQTAASPMALGRSEICLPTRALAELDPAQQQAMLAHELAHLVRRDPQWLSLLAALEIALFFQPLNGLARKQMQEAAEYLCDDWAVQHTGANLSLARCLAEVASWVAGTPHGGHGGAVPTAAVSGMAAGSTPLVRRVERLLDGARSTEPQKLRPRWLLAAAIVPLLVGCASPGVTVRPANPKPQAELAAAAAPRPESSGNTKSASGGKGLHIQSGPRSIQVSISGEVEFNEDRTDVKSISEGGSFVVEETLDGQTRKLEITPLDGDGLKRTYSVNGKEQPYDSGAHAWLAGVLSQMDEADRNGIHKEPFSGLPAPPNPGEPPEGGTLTISMNRTTDAGESRITGTVHGTVTFTVDGKAIESIADGGAFELEETKGGATRTLVAKPGANSELSYTYTVNWQEQPYDEAARSWLADVLPEVANGLTEKPGLRGVPFHDDRLPGLEQLPKEQTRDI